MSRLLLCELEKDGAKCCTCVALENQKNSVTGMGAVNFGHRIEPGGP